MSKNKEYAKKLYESEEYKRPILAFKHFDNIPENADDYADEISFLCAIAAEVWDRDKPFYITNENILCGGSVYSGLGAKKMTKEDFDLGMEMTIGQNKAYCSRETMRRVNQQMPHFFKSHKYMLIGKLEDIEDPDVIMIIAEADKVMRLCKAYTWKTGELVKGLQGTAWCAQAFPKVYREKTMTCDLGDPPSRVLMNLEPGEMYCTIHWDLLPIIVDNLKNISSGDIY